jgi:hypothetical protein
MMNSPPANALMFDDPAEYRIRVCGRVPASWSKRLGGMTITVETADADPPVSTLVGELEDQASLAGVLNTLYDLHLAVLSVDCLMAG